MFSVYNAEIAEYIFADLTGDISRQVTNLLYLCSAVSVSINLIPILDDVLNDQNFMLMKRREIKLKKLQHISHLVLVLACEFYIVRFVLQH